MYGLPVLTTFIATMNCLGLFIDLRHRYQFEQIWLMTLIRDSLNARLGSILVHHDSVDPAFRMAIGLEATPKADAANQRGRSHQLFSLLFLLLRLLRWWYVIHMQKISYLWFR